MYGQTAYLNGQSAAAELLGMSPANQSRAAGESTPLTTATGLDRQMLPWHPDSPGFWLAVVAALTIGGMLAADVRVRVFRKEVRGSVGNT